MFKSWPGLLLFLKGCSLFTFNLCKDSNIFYYPCHPKQSNRTTLYIYYETFLQTFNINRIKTDRSRKEVFQPHLPVRLPCYDLAPITSFTLGRSLRSRTSGTPGFHGLTGGVYKARERIHRAVADARLLANPASWSRVADSNPN